MGLDNIPKNYPCEAQGTAVIVNRTDATGNVILDDDGSVMTTINCEATQSCGGCPWKNALPPTEGRVMGIFGTDCWYRGKYGNALLEEVTSSDPMGDNLSFYGDNEDGTEKSPESCVELADFIDGLLSAMGDDTEEYKSDLEYASWYLRWSAEVCGGLVCWY